MFVKGESQLLLSLLDNGNDEINKEHMHVETYVVMLCLTQLVYR
jgi:hypothetical protein